MIFPYLKTLHEHLMHPFAMLLVVIVAIWAILMWATAARNCKHMTESTPKICPGCATPHPHHAAFCRNCGRKL
jgi:hypothetical protein